MKLSKLDQDCLDEAAPHTVSCQHLLVHVAGGDGQDRAVTGEGERGDTGGVPGEGEDWRKWRLDRSYLWNWQSLFLL